MLKIKPQMIKDAVNFYRHDNGLSVDLYLDMEILEDRIRIGDSVVKFHKNGDVGMCYLDLDVDEKNEDETEDYDDDDDDGYGGLDDEDF